MKLYMMILGCRPKGRNTEQHDVFFGIGDTPQSLLRSIKKFWPDGGTIHIDSWREVTKVDGYKIEISSTPSDSHLSLYFINLGGYKPGDPEEYHYKVLSVSKSVAMAIKTGKASAFYKHCTIPGSPSHIDDKYGIGVDDMAKVSDILPPDFKGYFLKITPSAEDQPDDILHVGYLSLTKLRNLVLPH